ncbi:MAG TPA: NAD(P)/FAD-dependent oxidoreductase [Thermoanaerobaculia bacterium]|nr:NAD(P)/FAD-dependent oxidoreductase [Thermoanaerobaculia bacterium]
MRYDAIIIGAGAAGLAAARSLSGAGKRVCILEARQRIGGRILSLHFPDLPHPVELGAEFIHGEGASTFSIVDAAALTAAELPDDHWWSDGADWERLDNFWRDLDRIRGKIPARGDDLSFAEFLRSRKELTARERQLACNFVEGYHASHAERISAQALRASDSEQSEETPGGNRQFRLAQGQDSIIAWLRAGLDPARTDLRLGTVATRVQWSPNKVEVECRSGVTEKLRANALILTVPIGVWKAGAIEFDPPLREKANALAHIEAGHVVKMAFRFRERFWDKEGPINFLHSDDRFMPTWWTPAPFRSPILIGWAGGAAADALLAEGEDALRDRALDAFARAWLLPRREVDSLLVTTYTHDWQRDPYSRCAYSYAAVGGRNAAASLAKPLKKTLFFAGEATSSDETGTVAGAMESGTRAARELLRSLS